MRRKAKEEKEMGKMKDMAIEMEEAVNILDNLDDVEIQKLEDMIPEEMMEVIATHEDHHNEHHEREEELKERLNKKALRDLDEQVEANKARQLLTFFKWGLNSERIENSMDGDFIPSIDPPELEYGLYIEPRLAEKIRRLLREEIKYAENLHRY
jgi:hypothetical protein